MRKILGGLPDHMNVSERLKTRQALQTALAGLGASTEDRSPGQTGPTERPAPREEPRKPKPHETAAGEGGITRESSAVKVLKIIVENKELKTASFNRGGLMEKAGSMEMGTAYLGLVDLETLGILRVLDKKKPKGEWAYELGVEYRDAPEEALRSIMEDKDPNGLRRMSDQAKPGQIEKVKMFLKLKLAGKSGASGPSPAGFVGGFVSVPLLANGGLGAWNYFSVIAVLAVAAMIYYYLPVWWRIAKAKSLFRKYMKAEGDDEKIDVKGEIESETDFELIHYPATITDSAYEILVVQEGVEVRERTLKFLGEELKVIWTDYTTTKTKLLYLPLEIVAWTIAIIAIIAVIPFMVIYAVGKNIVKDNPFRTLYRTSKARKVLTEYVTLRDELESDKPMDPFEAEIKEERLAELGAKWKIGPAPGQGMSITCDASIRIAPGIRMLYEYSGRGKKNVYTFVSLGKYDGYFYRARLRNAPIVIAIEFYRLYRKTVSLAKKMPRFLDDLIRAIPVIDKKIVFILDKFNRKTDGEEEKGEKAAEEEIALEDKGDILNGFNEVVKNFVKKSNPVEFTRKDFRGKRIKSKKGKEAFSYTTCT
ncbi:MAG: hypothetical protein WBB84_04210, partial [Candidatus Omnitrophota bacterium]